MVLTARMVTWVVLAAMTLPIALKVVPEWCWLPASLLLLTLPTFRAGGRIVNDGDLTAELERYANTPADQH